MNSRTGHSRLSARALLLPLSLTSLLLTACSDGGGVSLGGGDPVTDPDVQTVGCVDNTGIDLFAAESSESLGLSWNNQAAFNASGGYRVRYGTATATYLNEHLVSCTALDCETALTGLTNGTDYFIIVDSLDGGNVPTGSSCEIIATPHKLTFTDDTATNPSTAVQSDATIASGWDGTPLFLAWVENSKVMYIRSNDRGATWSAPNTLLATGTAQSEPNLTFRRRITQTDPNTGELKIITPPALIATLVVDGTVKVIRGDFPEGPTGAVSFSAPVDLGTGASPAVAAYDNHIEVAYERNNAIYAHSSIDGGLNYSAEQRIDSAVAPQTSNAPDITIDPSTHNVYVAYQGLRDSGNEDIYLNYSTNSGTSYQATEVRVDDSIDGGQSNVSLSLDPRTGHVMATWEDRRSGADVYFSRSTDGGVTWETNLNPGAGLTGDQFTPKADIDPGRNVFVLFIDQTSGQKPLFNRFNAEGSFDVPAEVSSVAGTAGAAAKGPTLTVDKLGRVYVAWSENRDGATDNIFFARGE